MLYWNSRGNELQDERAMQMVKEKIGGLVVLFGGTGDLATRMLLPALHQLYQRKLLSENFAILGVAPENITDDEFQNHVRGAVENGVNFERFEEGFFDHCRYQSADVSDQKEMKDVAKKMGSLTKEFEIPEEYMYYYSIAPSLYDETTTNIKAGKFFDLGGNHRVIVEKPVGDSLQLAKEYGEIFERVFDKESIYYMDHFAGIDFIQNILATRYYNPFIEGIWNKNFVENVQISVPENLTIEDRGAFYDETGALLDMFQNHLLQVLSIVATELPDELSNDAIHKSKLTLLKNIPSFDQETAEQKVVRGQYKADSAGHFKSYRNEDNVPSDSMTETYVAVEINIDTPRWEGVPFYLRTGKSLIEDYIAVDIILKQREGMHSDVPTRITFMALPTKGMSIVLNQKEPRNEYEPVITFLGPDEETFGDEYVADPYENMIYDALAGDRKYFPSFEQILEQWRITDSIVDAWKELPEPKFPNYRAHTFGPIEAETLLVKNNHEWIKRT
jgi:glucose-6-phosphate 1-dehydrogenase